MVAEKKSPLEQELTYWKDHISVRDVLSCELSYSLIYDNIHPDKIGQAMSTVGLEQLPSHFFLIQVDDYQNYASRLRVTQEFFQKTRLVKLLRDCMAQQGIAGFAANLVGMERIICFLCCQDQGEDLNEYLLGVAELFKKTIREQSPYTISVCISGRCSKLSHYSKMYPKMEIALGKSYFSGKEFSILLEEVDQNGGGEPAEADLNQYFPELLAAVARSDHGLLELTLQRIFQTILSSQMSRQKSRTEMWRLMQRLEEYCIRQGVAENWIQACNEQAMTQILACNFIADTRICFRDYCGQVSQALKECGIDEKGASFTVPVEEYVADHYGENLRLGDLAGVLGFSEGHFARTFRKKFGCSFVEYLTQYRLEKSKQLLADTQVPIEQIAYRVGLNSHSYFCTCFKRACGMTPGAYRTTVLQGNGQNIES